MTDNAEAARALAAEYGIDIIETEAPAEEPERDELDDIMWEQGPELMPALDIKNGIVYQTHRIARKKRTPGKKGQPEQVKIVLDNICITSARELFFFSEENVSKRGYTFPKFTTVSSHSRWADADMRAFAEGTDTADSPFDVFMQVRKTFETYIEFADEIFYDVLALFVMGSYIFKAFPVTSYLHFNGTAGSGKSQCLNILEAIGFNPMMTSSITEAALFRQVAGNPGLMLLDETEKFDSERGKQVRTMLLAGYKYSGTSTRTDREASDGPFVIVEFPVYCPKAFASIEPLDNTLASRCVVVQMRPAIRTIPAFPHEDDIWYPLRNQLYLWSMYHGAKLVEHARLWKDTHLERAPGIINRPWEIASYFVVVADYIGGEMLSKPIIDFFTDYYKKSTEAQNATDRVRILLRALPRVLQEKQAWAGSYYALKDIHEVVVRYMDEDSREYYKTRTASKGLDTLGFRDKQARPGGVFVKLTDERIREEMKQRRLDPFPEDQHWFDNTEIVLAQPEPEPEAAQTGVDWDAFLAEREHE